MADGILTKWQVRDIQDAVHSLFGNTAEMIPNVSFGFFKSKGMESDLLRVTPYGYLHEYEIKRSRSDFLADFKKKCFHNDVRIAHLTFVMPEAMAGEWLRNFCKENYQTFRRNFDFMFYREEGDYCEIIRPIYGLGGRSIEPKFTNEYYWTDEMTAYIDAHDPDVPYRRSLFSEELKELFRLCTIRFWTHYGDGDAARRKARRTLDWIEKERKDADEMVASKDEAKKYTLHDCGVQRRALLDRIVEQLG